MVVVVVVVVYVSVVFVVVVVVVVVVVSSIHVLHRTGQFFISFASPSMVQRIDGLVVQTSGSSFPLHVPAACARAARIERQIASTHPARAPLF